MLKIGIAGIRGLSTLMGFRAQKDVTVSAICDLDEAVLAKVQKEYRIPHAYRIFDDMLDSDLDAVVIATPMQCHVPQAIAALQARKHVLSEVTAGVCMDELWWLIENVESSGKVYMMAENYCYIPDNQLILNLIRNGFLGEVYYGEGEYLHNIQSLMTYDYGLHKSKKTSWRKYWQLGRRGAFYPTHSIGPLMQWLEPERIEAVACFGSGRHCDLSLRQEDTTLTMCQLTNGKLARIRIDALSPRPHNMAYYTVQGTKGVVESSRIAGEPSQIWLKDSGQPVEEAKWQPLEDYEHYLPERYQNATEEQKKSGHGGGDFFIVEDFVRAIREGTPTPIDVYKACEWTAIAFLSELSIMNKSRLIDMPHFRKNMPYDDQVIKI
ncbi:MAG: Gfo/Idh/MocA family oxidoreductase [Clostridia bacterium]|nr:Gfo/Idh/MocA family oxidoreductase [Clostridia bacterium]